MGVGSDVFGLRMADCELQLDELPRWRHNLRSHQGPLTPHTHASCKHLTVHIEPSILLHASLSPCMPSEVPGVPRRAGHCPPPSTQLTRHRPAVRIVKMKGALGAAILLLLMAVGASHALDDQVPLYEAFG